MDTSVLEGRLARSRTVPEFTMQVITNETGIPADTIRSWERRYGFPQPQRTDSNRRLYTQRDLVAIAWIRDQTERGHGAREAIAALQRLLDRPDAPAASEALAPLSPVQTLTGALIAGDLMAANDAWDGLALSVSAEGLCEHVLLPAHLRLAEELMRPFDRHRAEAFLQRKATVLLDAASPERGNRPITILTFGEVHVTRLPAITLAITLAHSGHRIAHPVADLSDAATLVSVRDDPDRSPLIVVTPQEHPALDALVTALDDREVHLWWPGGGPDDDRDRWLPGRLAEARDALS